VRQFVAVLLVVAGVYALTLLAPVITVLVAALLLALLMFIPARFLARYTRLDFKGAVVVIYLILILVIVGLVLNFIPRLVDAGNSLIVDLRLRYDEFLAFLRTYQPEQGLVEIIGLQIDLDPTISQIRSLLLGAQVAPATGGNIPLPFNPGEAISFTTSTISAVVSGITGLFSSVFLALFLSFLILLDLPNYQGQLFRFIPASYHREMFLLVARIMKVWNGFFRGQVTLGIIIGVVTWAQLQLMGVRDPIVLALITALISLIPTIGGIIALIPLGLVPLVQGSSVFTEMPNGTFALLVVGINLVISQVIWNGIAPKIMGDAVALPLPVIIVGIVLGTAIGGVLGAFLVVPILGTVRVIFFYLMNKITRRDPYPDEEAPPITDLASL
jgi:predicted PurR-regulated permease PerM